MHSPTLSLSLPRARREISRLRAVRSAAILLLDAVRRDALSVALIREHTNFASPPLSANSSSSSSSSDDDDTVPASTLADYVNPSLFQPVTLALFLTLPLLYPLSFIPPSIIAALAIAFPLYYSLVLSYLLTEIAMRPPWYTPSLPTTNCPPYWSTAIHDPSLSLSLPFTSITLTTPSHTLRGWHIPSPTHPTTSRHILCVHGAGRDRRAFLRHAAHLATLAHVTLIDTSEHGESSTTAPGGRGTAFGAREQHDVAAAVAHIRATHPCGAIAVVGTSTGASAAILASANGRTPGIACIVAENPFARADDLLRHHLDSATENYLADEAVNGRRCRSALFWLASKVLLLRMGSWVGPADVAENVACPLLVAHSKVDAVVPFAHGWEVYENAKKGGGDVRFFAVEDAVHCALFDKGPEEWIREVGGFLEDSFAKYDGGRFAVFGPNREPDTVDQVGEVEVKADAGEEWED